MVAQYDRAGLEVELQVRYHPPPGQDGDLAAWTAYVRHVVDVFGSDPHVVAMTITNEVNVTFSPNTSDGSYTNAEDALIQGIEAAHDEAAKRGDQQLQFGFTYAYRFSPPADAAFFSYLGSHGGGAFRQALGFVGVDFYPGSVYPPTIGTDRHLPQRHRSGARHRPGLLHAPGGARCHRPDLDHRERDPHRSQHQRSPAGQRTDPARPRSS